jgi:glycosyltransferase involved in cell wall biosynthesis
MGKKLCIVVPHYKEPWDVCKFLFDSIELQHGIDFSDFNVLVVNDGEDCVLDRSVFDRYSYEIKYAVKPHGGLSDTRNYGIDHADSEYVMFCDCDDGFLSNYGLHLVFGAIQEGFDLLNSAFIEEQPLNGSWKIFRRDKNLVFVHGKCYRRKFLLDKKIRFDKDLHFSEDSVFNKIAYHEAGKYKYIETPFYLWVWREGSTVRKDRETLVLRKYDQVMLMRTRICEQLAARGVKEEYMDSVCKTIADSYYDFNEPVFIKAGHEKLMQAAEREFKKFYRQFSRDFMSCDSDRIAKALMEGRLMAYDNGMKMERIDFKSWLKHIKNEVKL